MPSDTFFTQPPEWSGSSSSISSSAVSPGATFFAALIDLFGEEVDRPLARLGYLIAFPAVLVCAPLLSLDLAPGTVPAHADPVRDVRADVQVVVGDVRRLGRC
jgi:hypothetical protein